MIAGLSVEPDEYTQARASEEGQFTAADLARAEPPVPRHSVYRSRAAGKSSLAAHGLPT